VIIRSAACKLKDNENDKKSSNNNFIMS